MKLRLSGWKEGILMVSLMRAIRDYSEHSLIEAKDFIDNLIKGDEIELSFTDEDKMNKFRELAYEYGVLNIR